MRPLFVYGTLMDRDLLRVVLGREIRGLVVTPARLTGFAVERAEGAAFPLIVAREGATAPGQVIYGLADADMRRLEAYEGVLYRRMPATVETASGPIEAELFAPTKRLASSGQPWQFAEWQARHKAAILGEEGGTTK